MTKTDGLAAIVSLNVASVRCTTSFTSSDHGFSSEAAFSSLGAVGLK